MAEEDGLGKRSEDVAPDESSQVIRLPVQGAESWKTENAGPVQGANTWKAENDSPCAGCK